MGAASLSMVLGESPGRKGCPRNGRGVPLSLLLGPFIPLQHFCMYHPPSPHNIHIRAFQLHSPTRSDTVSFSRQ